MPALNAELRRKINGTFNEADNGSLVYLKTTLSQVEGLMSDGKIDYAILPEGVVGGMKFVDSYNCSLIQQTLKVLFNGHIEPDGSNKHSAIGSFIIISTGDNEGAPLNSMAITNTLIDSTNNNNEWVLKYYEDGVEVSGNNTVVQSGDWVIYKGFEIFNVDTVRFKFAIVNNTYANATQQKAGLMSPDDKTAHDSLKTTFLDFNQTAINKTFQVDEVLSNITVDSKGRLTALSYRNLTLANLGYSGANNATYNEAATKIEAEEGTNAVKFMTPQRTLESIRHRGMIDVLYSNNAAGFALADPEYADNAFALFQIV